MELGLNQIKIKWIKKVFCKETVLKVFAKFTGKNICRSVFFCKDIRCCPKILVQEFSCDFCEIFQNKLFIGHLWMAASGEPFPRSSVNYFSNHPLSTYAKFYKKLTFLTLQYEHVRNSESLVFALNTSVAKVRHWRCCKPFW